MSKNKTLSAAKCAKNGVPVAAFAYDAKSCRVRKETPAATHTCFCDGWNLVEERIARARRRFSTKYFDAETGLYYYGYRYYSPSLMR